MFKICLIGTGNWASYVHGPSMRKYAEQHPDTELSACASLSESEADVFRSKFGFKRYYPDFVEMLRQEKPDAVSIILPVNLTTDIACKVMDMGFPVFLEKPPGMTQVETNRLIEAAERNKVINMVGFNRRYTPVVRKLKELIREHAAPDGVLNIGCEFFRFNRKDPDFSTTAVHGIDTVRFLAGSDFEHVRFTYQSLPKMGDTVANFFLDCRFRSGATDHLRFCPTVGTTKEQYTVHTDRHSWFLTMPDPMGLLPNGRLIHTNECKLLLDQNSSDFTDGPDIWDAGGFWFENSLFLDSVRTGKPVVGDIRSGLQTVQIAECIRNRLPEFAA